MPLLPADFTHARPCKPFCEKFLTLPDTTVDAYPFSTAAPEMTLTLRIKIKLKGLPPALHRQQALSVA